MNNFITYIFIIFMVIFGGFDFYKPFSAYVFENI